jgi:uncharacterized protein with NRDE domain
MCTVSFVPVADGALLVSNRDERKHRQAALPPHWVKHNHAPFLYPTDADAGGTWIVVGVGRAAILLNGALTAHTPQPPYRLSRGRVLLDIAAATDPLLAWQQQDFHQIEPFTLVLYIEGGLWHGWWDGEESHMHARDAKQSHIWSSATLYDQATSDRRARWFSDWQSNQADAVCLDDLMKFHRFGGDGNAHHDLFMNRENEVFTVSITGVHMQDHQASMVYKDVLADLTYAHHFLFTEAGVQ